MLASVPLSLVDYDSGTLITAEILSFPTHTHHTRTLKPSAVNKHNLRGKLPCPSCAALMSLDNMSNSSYSCNRHKPTNSTHTQSPNCLCTSTRSDNSLQKFDNVQSRLLTKHISTRQINLVCFLPQEKS